MPAFFWSVRTQGIWPGAGCNNEACLFYSGDQVVNVKLTFLGTGDAGCVPVYGCDCPACSRANIISDHRRRHASLLLESNGSKLLVDAGQWDLADRFPAGSLSNILLTDCRIECVQGLFQLRNGRNISIDVVTAGDLTGFGDLVENPGILNFTKVAKPFKSFVLGDISVMPVSLKPSGDALGYVFTNQKSKFAYIVNTDALPQSSIDYLASIGLDLLLAGCSSRKSRAREEVVETADYLTAIRELHGRVRPSKTILTHISHDFDAFLMTSESASLPPDIEVAHDRMSLVV